MIPSIPPEPQFNQWACGLACFVWNMKKNGIPGADQQSLIHKHKGDIPAWLKGQEGLLTRGGLINLTHDYYPYRKILCTNLATDCKNYLHIHYNPNYICGYVLTRKPTNHCMAILGWDLDNIHLMDPTPPGRYIALKWNDLEQNHDADFLLFFR